MHKAKEIVEVRIGRTPEQAGATFLDTWGRAARGEAVAARRVLSFESWEALASVMTAERYRLLRHLRRQPEPSISALAQHLDRHLRRVQADVYALEAAGLITRTDGRVEATVDRLEAVVDL